MTTNLNIGIDLGGSKIELIALDLQGVERLRVRQVTPAGDYQATLALMADMVIHPACAAQHGCGERVNSMAMGVI